jgi:hypothetical protein
MSWKPGEYDDEPITGPVPNEPIPAHPYDLDEEEHEG